MLGAIKKSLAFLFLSVFLIPNIGESIHQFQMEHVHTCKEDGKFHIHEIHHHCQLCDYNFIAGGEKIESVFLKKQEQNSIVYSFPNSECSLPILENKNLRRGPPQI